MLSSTKMLTSEIGSMLSKKSFWGAKQFFLEALVRRYEKDVGGHIIIRISNRQPSLGLYAELEYRRPVSTCDRGKIRSVHFGLFRQHRSFTSFRVALAISALAS